MITILIRLKEYRQIQKRNRKIENIRHFFFIQILFLILFFDFTKFSSEKTRHEKNKLTEG